MWSENQAQTIRDIALAAVPGIRTYAIPQGMQVSAGPDAVVAHLVAKVPALLDQ